MGKKKDGLTPLDKTSPDLSNVKLTPKQKAFVREYLKHCNAAKAARDAGLGTETTKRFDQLGYQMLSCDEVQAELNRRIKKAETESELSKNWVLKQLKGFVTYDPASHLEIATDGTIALRNAGGSFPRGLAKHLDLSTGASESSGEGGDSSSRNISIRGRDRIRALELIAKLMGYMDARTGQFDEASREAHQRRVSEAIRRRTG